MSQLVMVGANWFLGIVSMLFISMFDFVAYTLVAVSYDVFYGVSNLDLFGGGSAGAQLYEGITRRVYLVLSVIMVFIFAYQLILLIANPDGDTKKSSNIVKDTIISIVMLIVLPLVYKYMMVFQSHVLVNQTIPAIILGTNAADSNNGAGKNIAFIVFNAFYQPDGTTYTTFFNDDGVPYGSVDETNCVEQVKSEDVKGEFDDDYYKETCETYIEAINDWYNSKTIAGINNLTFNWDLQKKINETMSYWWLISTAAGLAVAYMFFLYAIDIGVRAVKLGLLQLISPIPVIFRVFPQTRKTFDKWFFHIKKAYVELFVRVAVIFFAIEIIKLVPQFIKIIFEANNGIDNSVTRCFATVILILGILKFCQDAPGLFKELFDTGGMLSDINLKPTMPQTRIKDNKALMLGYSKAANVAGGFVGRFKRSYKENRAAADPVGGTTFGARARATWRSLPTALRGVGSGLLTKANTEASFKENMMAGANAANKSFDTNELKVEKRKNKLEYYENLNTMDKKSAKDILKNENTNTRTDIREQRKAERKAEKEYFETQLTRDQSAGAVSELYKAITDNIGNIITTAATPGEDNRVKALEAERDKYGKNDPNYQKYDTLVKEAKTERNEKRAEKYDNTQAKEYLNRSVSEIDKAITSLGKQDITSKMQEALDSVIANTQNTNVYDEFKAKETLTAEDYQKAINVTLQRLENKNVTVTGDDINFLDQLKKDYKTSESFSSALQQQQNDYNTKMASKAKTGTSSTSDKK